MTTPAPSASRRVSRKASLFTESVIREMTREAMKYGAVNLSQGFPDDDTFPELKQLAVEAIAGECHQYTDPWGSPLLRQAVSDKVELIVTDEWTGYRNVKFEFPHAVVRHTAGEYVNGVIHTNTIEGFWSLLKRGIVGTFHKTSKAYLPLYVAEFEWRHNIKGNEDPFGELIARC